MKKDKELQKLGNRIKEARLNKNLTQQDLANRLGTSKSVISGYEAGKNDPAQSMVLKISEALDVSINWLMFGKEIQNIIPIKRINKIPILGSIACGDPILADSNIQGYFSATDPIQGDFIVVAQGDSMIEAGIYPGNYCFIRIQPDVENGEIAAVLIEDEVTLKKVYKTGSEIILQPCNSKYSPIILTNDIVIQGKLIGVYQDRE